MTVNDLFGGLGVTPLTLPGTLDAHGDAGEFETQFRQVFSSSKAKEAVSVVYVWATENAIPRLRGQSDVCYVGQTDRSLCERNRKHAKEESAGDNWHRYHHIFKSFGPIHIHYAPVKNPKAAEGELLRWYFNEHLEVPPLNKQFPRSTGTGGVP